MYREKKFNTMMTTKRVFRRYTIMLIKNVINFKKLLLFRQLFLAIYLIFFYILMNLYFFVNLEFYTESLSSTFLSNPRYQNVSGKSLSTLTKYSNDLIWQTHGVLHNFFIYDIIICWFCHNQNGQFRLSVAVSTPRVMNTVEGDALNSGTNYLLICPIKYILFQCPENVSLLQGMLGLVRCQNRKHRKPKLVGDPLGMKVQPILVMWSNNTCHRIQLKRKSFIRFPVARFYNIHLLIKFMLGLGI